MRVEVEAVAWSVGGRTIIDDISLSVRPGTVTGLLGPNGSGKSTLLNVVAGLRSPAAGRVLVDGRDLHRMRPRLRAQQVAYVEQHATTGLDLSVREVVELGRIPHRGRWRAGEDGAGRLAEAMRLARIDQLADRAWQTLSGGERQRTQLARALAQEPSLLLLDEPTNHLDLGHQIDFMTTVRGLGITTIAALHDLELAAAFCDRLVVLQDGGVVASGAVADVLTSELVAEVYGVEATIEAHPRTGRPHLVWHGVRVGDLVG
ncbi:ABC transporter ATP-binding protein [Nocardioides marmoriginsengisoli]|uniref:ABC transporter ATP-binding protein n=1 Tax=Nocardioides marmoriginsengisoli TaxID=661483 RepID=A0A3N0CN52_9ACTN|nr:ABC transporter ATP-binding protein [Nocardioides marmoriginsengisoli]RNL64898.1 ABC transporter ATP-binding protein [Nocardioides marmoriginsengisoli]